MPNENPCVSCGACCAAYRVSFHWSEADTGRDGGVPAGFTTEIDLHRNAMLGTLSHPPRCVALSGRVGEHVLCLIYDRRPEVCRNLEPSFQNGLPSEKCDRARVERGLLPLTPADWEITRPPEIQPPLPRAA